MSFYVYTLTYLLIYFKKKKKNVKNIMINNKFDNNNNNNSNNSNKFKKKFNNNNSSVTVNTESLNKFLDKELSKEIKSVRRDTIHQQTLSKGRHVSYIRHGKNQMSKPPSPVKHFTKEMIMEKQLEPDYEQIRQQMRDEAEKDVPNKSKLVLGALCQPEWSKVSELPDRIRKICDNNPKLKIASTSPSSVISTYMKSAGKKPIRLLIQKRVRAGSTNTRGFEYRLFPYCCKLTLSDLLELSHSRGTATYSLRDARRKVPEIDQFLKEAADADDSDSTTTTTTRTPKSHVINPNQPQPAKTTNKPIISEVGISNQTITVNVNVSISPIKLLFGITPVNN